MSKLQFNLLDTAACRPHGHLIGLWGGSGVGKTYMAFTMPGPYAYIFNPSENWERTLEPLVAAGKKIYRFPIGIELADTKNDDEKQRLGKRISDEFQATLDGLFKPTSDHDIVNSIKTVIIDPREHFRQYCLAKHFGAGKPKHQFNYGVANLEDRPWTDDCKLAKPHVVFIHNQKEVYNDKGNPTGKFEWTGQPYDWGKMSLLVHLFTDSKPDGTGFKRCASVDKPMGVADTFDSLKPEESRLHLSLPSIMQTVLGVDPSTL
jgi:hypothetical protein